MVASMFSMSCGAKENYAISSSRIAMATANMRLKLIRRPWRKSANVKRIRTPSCRSWL
jgi:hypothetical protein